MDIVSLAFMGFMAGTLLIMLIVMVSFMTMVSKTISSPHLNPQPEPPQPYRMPIPEPPKPPEPPSDIPPADTGLELEDFIPDMNKPVKVVIKEDEHGSVIDPGI